MIGALFLAIPRTSLGISVYEREVVRYNHITAAALLLQKIEELTLYIIQQEKRMESMEAEISFYQETVKGTLSAN